MRNWGDLGYYLRGELMDEISLSVTRLPAGQAGHAATLGGSYIAIPGHTRYLQEALALIRLAAGPEAQKRRARTRPSFAPTIPALYEDPAVLATTPHFATLKSVLTTDAVPRPSKITGKLYPRVSDAYFSTVHAILTGRLEAATAVASLEARLVEITGFEVGRPADQPSLDHSAPDFPLTA
jgi:trehalose/maltose transport system substrate-binding protein